MYNVCICIVPLKYTVGSIYIFAIISWLKLLQFCAPVCPYFTAAIWIILPHFSSKARQQWLGGAVCLENLNMTKKMSSNPGLTCAVRWKSCSDCKAAWVSILFLHCLSVTLDKLPNTVRAQVYQVHYTNIAESDYTVDDSWVQVSAYSSAQLWLLTPSYYLFGNITWKTLVTSGPQQLHLAAVVKDSIKINILRVRGRKKKQ